jgi:hypothetical protein
MGNLGLGARAPVVGGGSAPTVEAVGARHPGLPGDEARFARNAGGMASRSGVR